MNNLVQIWAQPSLRDFANVWNAQAATLLAGLDPACYRLALFSAPKYADRTIAANGYAQIQIPLQVGSFIIGLANSRNFAQGANFSVMVTDLSTNQAVFNAPIEGEAFLGTPFWLPELYPIASPGLVRVELYNQTALATLAEVVLLVAEPRGGM